MRSEEILRRLRAMADPCAVAGMARYGINPKNTLGVSVRELRRMARQIGRDHQLAKHLWASGVHEARILACLIDEPALVTGTQMERWVKVVDSWDVCDQCCGNLFGKTPLAYRKAAEWSRREEQFVRRAGFVLMARLAVHDKLASDRKLLGFLPMIGRASTDDRNFVKKAVNWALRQIGKRSPVLHREALKTARTIQRRDSRAARWIAADAIRELTRIRPRGKPLPSRP
ncbi:MAG TPA: DNA alkylation repair protein [Candidatus Acidoferrum sp.]|nr:DNA alkylation repair protein [Candidatus Acidoferrum sp.]